MVLFPQARDGNTELPSNVDRMQQVSRVVRSQLDTLLTEGEMTAKERLRLYVKEIERNYLGLVKAGKLDAAESLLAEVLGCFMEEEQHEAGDDHYQINDMHPDFVYESDRTFYKAFIEFAGSAEQLNRSPCPDHVTTTVMKARHNWTNLTRREAVAANDDETLRECLSHFDTLKGFWESDGNLAQQSSALYEVGFIAEKLGEWQRAIDAHLESARIAGQAALEAKKDSPEQQANMVKALASKEQSLDATRQGVLASQIDVDLRQVLDEMETIKTELRPYVDAGNSEASRWESNVLLHQARTAQVLNEPEAELAFWQAMRDHPFYQTGETQGPVADMLNNVVLPRIAELEQN